MTGNIISGELCNPALSLWLDSYCSVSAEVVKYQENRASWFGVATNIMLLFLFWLGMKLFSWSHVKVTDLLWRCGLVLPQESLLLGGIWFAYCKHEADCKNRHLLLLSQAMKVHVDTLGIVCNLCIFELGPQHTIMGLGEEGAFFTCFIFNRKLEAHTHTYKK